MQKMQFCSRVVLATVLVTFAASLCAMPSAPQCSDCQPFPWAPGTVLLAAGFILVCTCSDNTCGSGFEFLIYRGENMWAGFHSSVLQYHVVYACGSRKVGDFFFFFNGLLKTLSKSSPSDFGTLSNVLYCFHFLLVLQQCV